MHQSVIDKFVDFTAPLEGVVTSLYADVRGLLTVGLGCLADPVSMALSLAWVLPDGSTPSQAEIARQWHVIKGQAAAMSRLHWRYAAKLTTMRLTDQGVLDLATQRLLANEKILRGFFPNWDLFPADAQMACCSMAWAVGAGFPRIFGNFRAAANAQNWVSAVAACAIRTENNPGIVPRNAANRLCLSSAASVLAQGLPLGTLYWPGSAPNASQRDEQLRHEAQLALANHVTDIAGHAAQDIADYDSETQRADAPDVS